MLYQAGTMDRWSETLAKYCIYNYLIDTKGLFTKESLKANKSLKAFNFLHSGHVRTVYYFQGVLNQWIHSVDCKSKPKPEKPKWPPWDMGCGEEAGWHSYNRALRLHGRVSCSYYETF